MVIEGISEGKVAFVALNMWTPVSLKRSMTNCPKLSKAESASNQNEVEIKDKCECFIGATLISGPDLPKLHHKQASTEATT